MAGELGRVLCSSCTMWELRDTSGVPDDYVCRKGIHLQLLTVRVAELELRVDSLWSIHDAENDVSITCSELVLPQGKGPQPDREWKTSRKSSARKVVQGSPVVIPLQNRYTALSTVEGDDSSGEGSSSQVHGTVAGSVAQEGRKKSGRAIVIGDSMVRGIDRRFCGRNRDSRMVCCLPGARVKDVSERVQDILKWEGEQPVVVVHIGTNDIGKKRDEVLRNEFKELGAKLKSRTSKVVISGLLPVPRDSQSRNRRIAQMNTWLEQWCSREGFKFLGHWDRFWGRWDQYKPDGLHLGRTGTNVLGGVFASAVGEDLN
uniref:uncharacterized protein n=1 Tax=Pristiophorus japonicus TaxID=55135 RepID=UPI00398EB7F6